MINESMTDTSFRSSGKQKKVTHFCHRYFTSFSNLLTWPMSKCAFAISDKALNCRTHKTKYVVKEDALRALPSVWLIWRSGKARCSPTHTSLFTGLFLALHLLFVWLFPQHSSWTWDSCLESLSKAECVTQLDNPVFFISSPERLQE